MKSYDIALIPGDGTGPEVLAEGKKVLDAACAKHGVKLNYQSFDFGGERYMRTGEILPDSAIEEFKKFHSMFLGAIGHPDVKPGILEVGILLKTRFALDQYINLRPVKLYPNVDCPLKDKKPEDIDFVVVRENTGGIYTGIGGVTQKGTPLEVATQVMQYSRPVVERCVKYAYEYTRRRNSKKKMLTLVHKCNVLTHCGDLWVRVHKEMGDKDYPEIKQDYNHVDACTMWFVKQPEYYDVIVTENLFGDIITDLAAIIQGGLGIAAGGNINPNGVSMFEPMGGSAPKYTGKNVINPLATISAGGMMMDTLGEPKIAAGDRQGDPRRARQRPDQEPRRRPDGHGHARGRGSHREDGELESERRGSRPKVEGTARVHPGGRVDRQTIYRADQSVLDQSHTRSPQELVPRLTSRSPAARETRLRRPSFRVHRWRTGEVVQVERIAVDIVTSRHVLQANDLAIDGREAAFGPNHGDPLRQRVLPANRVRDWFSFVTNEPKEQLDAVRVPCGQSSHANLTKTS